MYFSMYQLDLEKLYLLRIGIRGYSPTIFFSSALFGDKGSLEAEIAHFSSNNNLKNQNKQ